MNDMAVKPTDHPDARRGRIGVILLNLGTPEATDYWSMRRYLNEFLSDRRVIDLPRLFWQPLLQLIILSKRPFSSGEAYRAIWNNDLDESPLRTVTRSQAERVAARLQADYGDRVVVDWAMRYGNPSTRSVMERLIAQGCDRLVLMALYPQYAAPTTATAYDKAFEALQQMNWQPAVRTMGPYHDHPGYVDLLARSIEEHLSSLDHEPQKVLMSYHGVPKRYLIEGDPYHCMCRKTTRLVEERLGWDPGRIMTVFQSRFGSEEWLRPYLDETLESLPGQGVTRIAVISPAFVTDCVETLEEIDQQGRESFLHAGGEQFSYIRCLNDRPDHIEFLAGLARRELAGWIDPA
ncbi:MAG: ferrochelatase [Geminicoccaceae bacterium]|nr:ferrochelatase [Geminicoccaceae bacterium]